MDNQLGIHKQGVLKEQHYIIIIIIIKPRYFKDKYSYKFIKAKILWMKDHGLTNIKPTKPKSAHKKKVQDHTYETID